MSKEKKRGKRESSVPLTNLVTLPPSYDRSHRLRLSIHIMYRCVIEIVAPVVVVRAAAISFGALFQSVTRRLAAAYVAPPCGAPLPEVSDSITVITSTISHVGGIGCCLCVSRETRRGGRRPVRGRISVWRPAGASGR